MVSAAASSTSHTGPGGDGPLEKEVYKELPGIAFRNTYPNPSPSPKAAEKNRTAIDQPRQAERRQEDLVWAPGTEVVGKYHFAGSVAHVSTCDITIMNRQTICMAVSNHQPLRL